MPDYTPDSRIVHTSVTTVAGTLRAAPLKTAFDPGRVTVQNIEVVIPDGHSGLTGIAIVYDGQGVIPWSFPVDFIVGNDEAVTFDVGMLAGHAISIWTYNTGIYDHAHYLRFKVRDISLDVMDRAPQIARALVLN